MTRGPEHRLEFTPRFDKIVELLLYLAHKKPNADHYQAVKFFYLADREHINKFGRPITFDVYYALQYGPVASKTLDLLHSNKDVLEEAGIAALPIELEQLDKIIVLRRPLRAVDYDLFSKSDLVVFDAVLEEFGDKSFSELFDLTHEHFAYQNAWRHKSGRRSRMSYADMVEDSAKKAALIEDIAPVSAHMK